MTENKKFKINFFDIVIVLIVLCVGVGFYLFTNKDTTADTKKLTYVIELNKTTPGIGKLYQNRRRSYRKHKKLSHGKSS